MLQALSTDTAAQKAVADSIASTAATEKSTIQAFLDEVQALQAGSRAIPRMLRRQRLRTCTRWASCCATISKASPNGSVSPPAATSTWMPTELTPCRPAVRSPSNHAIPNFL